MYKLCLVALRLSEWLRLSELTLRLSETELTYSTVIAYSIQAGRP